MSMLVSTASSWIPCLCFFLSCSVAISTSRYECLCHRLVGAADDGEDDVDVAVGLIFLFLGIRILGLRLLRFLLENLILKVPRRRREGN
jgi:hypothetical protein